MVWKRSVDVSNLHPTLLQVMTRVITQLDHEGYPFKVYSGLRTFAEQDRLYSQGRSDPGRIVTYAGPGKSLHNYGLAIDLAPLNLRTDAKGDVWWPDPRTPGGSVWYQLERVLLEVTQGLLDLELDVEWGGRWKFRDLPHVQIRATIRELMTGYYPPADVAWLVHSHTTFLFGTGWMDRRVQFLLNSLGYNAGPVDGLPGPRTVKAMENAGYYGAVITESYVEDLVRRHAALKKYI